MTYTDRADAGKRLAQQLQRYRNKNAVVLALARGGVVPATEVAQALQLPLGLVLVRKIGHPADPEYAVAAVAEDDAPLFDAHSLPMANGAWLDQEVAAARRIIAERRRLYYGRHFSPPKVAGKIVIIVDDGIATGLTMEAAIRAIRRQKAAKIIAAAPVASAEAAARLKKAADGLILLQDPATFLGAVGAHYRSFPQVSDQEVSTTLQKAQRSTSHTPSAY